MTDQKKRKIQVQKDWKKSQKLAFMIMTEKNGEAHLVHMDTQVSYQVNQV